MKKPERMKKACTAMGPPTKRNPAMAPQCAATTDNASKSLRVPMYFRELNLTSTNDYCAEA